MGKNVAIDMYTCTN